MDDNNNNIMNSWSEGQRKGIESYQQKERKKCLGKALF